MLDINLNIYTDFSFVVNIRLCLILGSIPYACSVGNFILLIILSVTNKYILVIGIRLKNKLHFCDVGFGGRIKKFWTMLECLLVNAKVV